jgi:hypothetical protein
VLEVGRSRVRDPMRWMNFSIYLILPAALGPGVYSPCNRNEKQKQKNNICGLGQCVRMITLPPSVSRLSRQYMILNILQPYRPPRPVTGVAFLYFSNNKSAEMHTFVIAQVFGTRCWTNGACDMESCEKWPLQEGVGDLRLYLLVNTVLSLQQFFYLVIKRKFKNHGRLRPHGHGF